MIEYADHTRYEARIKNHYAGPGIYKCLITVTDNTNDNDKWWLPIKAYQIINLTVIADQTEEGWAKTWGEVNYEKASDVACDPWGYVCVVGPFEGTLDLDPGYYEHEVTSNGSIDSYLSVFDETGAFQWGLSFGGTGSDSGNSVTTDDKGNIYVVGYFEGVVDFDPSEAEALKSSNGGLDAYLVKFDRLGNIKFVLTWGGAGDDYAGAVSWGNWVGPTWGTILVGGSFEGSFKFWPDGATIASHGGTDAYLFRLDDDGASPWCATWGGDIDDFTADVTVGLDSNAYASGVFFNNDDSSGIDFDPGAGTDIHVSWGYGDAFLVKYNVNGDYVGGVHWGAGGSNDIAYGISDFIDDSTDSIFVTGTYGGVVDFDPGPEEYFLGWNGGADVFLTRFNLDLTHGWTYTWGSTEEDIGCDVDIDVNENPMVTGYFQDHCDFDPGPANVEGTSKGMKDVFLCYYSNAGNFQWARTWGGTQDVDAWSITQTEGQLFYVAGYYMDSNVEFDPCDTVDLHSSQGNEDAFLAKYLADGCWD